MSPDAPRQPLQAAGSPDDAPPASRRGLVVTGVIATAVTFVLLSLGVWQVQRLFWKLDLIERVNARVAASPVDAPRWPAAAPPPGKDYEYRHITVTGRFRHESETLVQASTERGPGFWVVTPLVREDGTVVLVNRGFVPPDKRDPALRKDGNVEAPVSVTGLLRLSEPGGGFLRNNDPAGNRWYSRDVAAIEAARGLPGAEPYFIDADDTANPGGLPVGGLTRIVFPNNHLVYAITWFALAAMLAGAIIVLGRREWARTHPPA